MRINLSKEWSLEIPDDIQHRKEGEHVVFWKPGLTLLTTIFAYSGEKHRQVLLANLKGRVEAEKLESIVENEGVYAWRCMPSQRLPMPACRPLFILTLQKIYMNVL